MKRGPLFWEEPLHKDACLFDHSRIVLQLGENDYINASLISMEEAQRNYILTQIKCAQYWPHREERDAIFEDTNFRVTFISEDVKVYYTVRQLELENLTQETREILHFHYTTWPDFGVPESPATFLNFLFKVRESGCLSAEQGPVVVHCSAGIGRSGTFCLVDTCLVLMSVRQDPTSVRLRDVLLEMRRGRMGLIQTADQLRFSYLAVIQGARDDSQHNDTIPPPFSGGDVEVIVTQSGRALGSLPDSQLRRRTVGDLQPTPTEESLAPPPPVATAAGGGVETQEHAPNPPARPEAPGVVTPGPREEGPTPPTPPPPPGSWSPVVVNVCLCTAFAFSAYVCYRACYH
ncbi:hypothetical protein CRUP_027629 [Coryphaenoides rupestris]|nr:hypothetical protein CRUP_027629 [Coryphaenoides rupestris]